MSFIKFLQRMYKTYSVHVHVYTCMYIHVYMYKYPRTCTCIYMHVQCICTHGIVPYDVIHVHSYPRSVPFISDDVVICQLRVIEAHPSMGQTTHIVVVESGILCGLVEALQCGPERGERERNERQGGEGLTKEFEA